MRQSFSSVKKIATGDPEMNLTPLIDVVFVVLIIFILIAPILDKDIVELADAAATEKEVDPSVKDKSLISIRVHGDNTIYLNRQRVTTEQLSKLLILEKKKYPQTTPQVFHDKRAAFGTYQCVKNACEEAGFEQMDIVLNPK